LVQGCSKLGWYGSVEKTAAISAIEIVIRSHLNPPPNPPNPPPPPPTPPPTHHAHIRHGVVVNVADVDKPDLLVLVVALQHSLGVWGLRVGGVSRVDAGSGYEIRSAVLNCFTALHAPTTPPLLAPTSYLPCQLPAQQLAPSPPLPPAIHSTPHPLLPATPTPNPQPLLPATPPPTPTPMLPATPHSDHPPHLEGAAHGALPIVEVLDGPLHLDARTRDHRRL